MIHPSTDIFTAFDCQLEIFDISGSVFHKYPNVIKGYIFNFTLGNNSISSDSSFSLEFHWTKEIVGSLDELKIGIESIKEKLLSIYSDICESVDQFAYINIFIINEGVQHKLVISSDAVDVSKLIDCNI